MQALNPCQSPDSLASSVLDEHRAVAQQRYRFLVQLREFDLHRAYKGRGRGPHGSRGSHESHQARDTPGWLQSTCGVPRDQAQEDLRVAYTLLNLPRIEAAFEAGDLSYAKVKALASVATLADETSLLAVARVMSDAQVEEYCARADREDRDGLTKCRNTDRSASAAPIYSAPVQV